MFSKRIFLSLITAAVLATMVNAQSNDRNAGWAAKMAGRGQATGTRSTGAAATNSSSRSSEDSDDDDDNKVRLEGTWRADGTFSSGNVDKALFTFGAGKNRNNGTVVHSDNFFFVPPASCLSAQGVWKRAVERRFIGTDEGFCFDTSDPSKLYSFDPFGNIKFRFEIELNRQGTEFDGSLHIDAFDVDGNLVFSDDAAIHGVRMRAEAPPH